MGQPVTAARSEAGPLPLHSMHANLPETFWTLAPERALQTLRSRPEGLRTDEVEERTAIYGANRLHERDDRGLLHALLEQLRSPLTVLLGAAAAIAATVGEYVDVIVIAAILAASVTVGLVQTRRATQVVARLRARVRTRVSVSRDGTMTVVGAEAIVPGDVIELSAGSLVPADAILLSAKDLFVNEALLTGEPYAVVKRPGPSEAIAAIGARRGCLWQGTTVRSGTGTAVVVRTGKATEVGRIAHRLVLRPKETDFERGIRRFGMLLARVVLVLVVVVFALNVVTAKPVIESLLFAIALAVGIAPEMLPAIVTVTLAAGAHAMARQGVIVKRLAAIESFGSMDVLCTDKTGTLTEGAAQLTAWPAVGGDASDRVLELAWLNAALQTGLPNPMDEAILRRAERERSGPLRPAKVEEIPYDLHRKRSSVVVEDGTRHLLICKGAFVPLLSRCTLLRNPDGEAPLDQEARASLSSRYEAWGAEGTRVLGLATRRCAPARRYARDDERDLCFEGFLLFEDPPKPGIERTVGALARAGIAIKIVTGDNRFVAAHVASAIGLSPGEPLTGAQIDALSDDALPVVSSRTNVFAEVDPRQKERIVLALREAGSVVGYMGDGINDAPALHAADVSISIEGAVDVAREAADFVLLERDLDVLRAGVLRGRTTFANTLKYLYTTESANFGNMLSMAISSAFLPFLPLTAGQILLNNFLSDLPATTIATDEVDPERIERPQRWDIASLRRFMLWFGAISSVFDLLTFALLLFVAKAAPPEFRTGWFVESLSTELAVALVVRTRRPFYRSRPSRWLLGTSALVAVVAIGMPYVPFAASLGFVPLPWWLLGMVLAVTVAYVVVVELAKRVFFGRATEVAAAEHEAGEHRQPEGEAPEEDRGGRRFLDRDPHRSEDGHR